MAANVRHIPATYPMKDVVKQGRLKLLTLVSFWLIHLSTSNLRQRATKMPGTTISPNPNMLYFSMPSSLRYGKSNLMGMSNFLATVTITSVPYTQNMSQKNKNQRSINPTLKLERSIFLRAMIEKSIPNTLLSAQYLVRQYAMTGMETMTVQMILANEISKSSISRIDFKNLGGLTCLMTLRYYLGKGRLTQSKLLDDITVAMLN